MHPRRGTPIEPTTAAVVVVDSQNDYYARQGALAPAQEDNLLHRSVGPQVAVLRAAASTGRLVVFIRDVSRPDHATSSPSKIFERLRTRRNNALVTLDWGYEGSWGSEVFSEIRQAAPGGLEIFKSRNSAFVNTSLDLVLRSNSIETIFVIGVATDVCVSATARDADDYGYRTVVVRDAVGGFKPALHDAALRIFRARLEVMESATVVQALRAPAVGDGSDA